MARKLQGADFVGADLEGANLNGALLQGADLRYASLQGTDLRHAVLWRALVSGDDETWQLADLRYSTDEPMTKNEADETIVAVSATITDANHRKAVVQQLTKALQTDERPSLRLFFPMSWESLTNVMFQADDPKPKPFPWGLPKWAAEQAYDEDLAKFLGDIACGGDVPEAQTCGLAARASHEPHRLWPKLFAARVTNSDCPPAKALPEDIRTELKQLVDSRPRKAEQSIEASCQSWRNRL